jgi:hypothetical protein
MKEELQDMVEKMPALLSKSFQKLKTEISESLRSQTQVNPNTCLVATDCIHHESKIQRSLQDIYPNKVPGP